MRFCSKLDLGICGLLVTTTLFFFPGAIFLVLGFGCVGPSNNDTSDEETTTRAGSCAKVDHKTITILFVFGFLFVFVGILVCALAFIIHRANGKQKRQETSWCSTRQRVFWLSVAGKVCNLYFLLYNVAKLFGQNRTCDNWLISSVRFNVNCWKQVSRCVLI